MTTYTERQARNDMSRTRAEHHGEPWSAEEIELLHEFWEDENTTPAEVSEALGRTIEACRQRYYYPVGQEKPRSKEHHDGWLIGFCTSCGVFGDVFCTGFQQKCEDCNCV